MDENLNENIKGKMGLAICILIILSISVTIFFITGKWVWHSNVSRYLDKRCNQTMIVRSDSEFSYKGKIYRIMFSTPKDKKDQLYLQCFEEKMNGLLYRPTYGSEQGECKALYGMTNHFVNDGTNDSFIIVYGYNKGFKANNFSVRKASNGEWMTQDISKQEYYLYINDDIKYAEIVFKDERNNDITDMINGK